MDIADFLQKQHDRVNEEFENSLRKLLLILEKEAYERTVKSGAPNLSGLDLYFHQDLIIEFRQRHVRVTHHSDRYRDLYNDGMSDYKSQLTLNFAGIFEKFKRRPAINYGEPEIFSHKYTGIIDFKYERKSPHSVGFGCLLLNLLYNLGVTDLWIVRFAGSGNLFDSFNISKTGLKDVFRTVKTLPCSFLYQQKYEPQSRIQMLIEKISEYGPDYSEKFQAALAQEFGNKLI